MSANRKDRSKSSQDSTHSPDDKRTREEADRVLSTSSQTDEVFETLDMAEDLGKKIEHVLQKLGKLDIIENRLNEMNTTLASIEHTVSRLDSELKFLKGN